MSDADNALAATAVGLNEDAKAARKKKGAEPPVGDGGAAEEATSAAVLRMETMATEAEFVDQRALVFDLRDFVLDQIKHRPKPWSACSQAEQRDVAAACEIAATELVRKVVEAIAAGPALVPARVLLTKIASGDDIVITGKVKCHTPEEEDKVVMMLHHQRGKHVMLTAATAEDYKQGERDAETDLDEPELFEADLNSEQTQDDE